MTIYHLDLSDDTICFTENTNIMPSMLSPSTPVANALTIGNFDGVHRGHQAMLAQLRDRADALNVATMVMIFEPQPREYFAQLKGDVMLAPARITTANEKIALLRQYGVDHVIVAQFNEPFRSLSARAFADLLAKQLNVKTLVLGDDFRFGHDRAGDSDFLQNYGLPVTNLPTITDNNASANSGVNVGMVNSDKDIANTDRYDNRISSTRIRDCLAKGDITTATHLLGHDYTITGEVLHGDKIGRTLNFPTANIALNRFKPALHGIFAVDVVIVEAPDKNDDALILPFEPTHGVAGLRPNSLFGTANIGIRPSVDKTHEWRLEVHFPEFEGDLYGKHLNVRFLHFLHGERHYDGLDALQKGIEQDVADLIAWRQAQE